MNATIAYVGSRTTKERNARGDGLNVFRVPAAGAGNWEQIQLVDDLVNPSYLAFDRTRRFLYAAHGDQQEISAFAIDDTTGRLARLNRQSTDGKNPVHLAFNPINSHVVVANHVTSTLALLPRNEDGTLGPVTHLAMLRGKLGPHRVEQPFAKPHQVEFDPSGRFIIVPDKGLDCVFTYCIDPSTNTLVEVSVVGAREGCGPRHVAFHPAGKFAYVINELDSTVTAYRFDPSDGKLTPFQILSALPDDFTGNSRASEIAVSGDGRFVYASNRGFDSIAVFAIGLPSGRLSHARWQPSGGKTPRFFAVAPGDRILLVANEDSDTIMCFERDGLTGWLKPAGLAARCGSPTCIVFR